MTGKIAVLPDAEEIRGRFSAAGFGPEVEANFVPFLVRHAGEEKNALGLVTMLLDEVHAAAKNSAPFLEELFLMIPDFVDVLVTDSDVAIPAKAIIEVNSGAAQGH